ncbi:protein tis11 [Anaeramoeba flamelloides]|uniref:Protein tis11 n=1 Tax=Anaeramoeba flamelloides TaxID=1746091 RepID=A0AAV7YGJ2_9EUKA|nr:protein tis11 [Anaeramoeba flamelloides]KAJ6248911.1 protein tis11 [Anaeramoeba flamelloides]
MFYQNESILIQKKPLLGLSSHDEFPLIHPLSSPFRGLLLKANSNPTTPPRQILESNNPKSSTKSENPRQLKVNNRNLKNLKYKTEVCRNFFGDECVCEFGKRCNFIHYKDKPESIALGSIHALKFLGLYHLVSNRNNSTIQQIQQPQKQQQLKQQRTRLQIFQSLSHY